MFHVVLYEPEIPPNTGNVMRLCANSGARLHLIKPLGFRLDDRSLHRAGLDYRVHADVRVHASLEEFIVAARPPRLLAFSTHGGKRYSDMAYDRGDALLFGPETRGLPQTVLAALPPNRRLRLPMVPGSRSLNLANAVAIALFEAWRQHDFAGGL